MIKIGKQIIKTNIGIYLIKKTKKKEKKRKKKEKKRKKKKVVSKNRKKFEKFENKTYGMKSKSIVD